MIKKYLNDSIECLAKIIALTKEDIENIKQDLENILNKISNSKRIVIIIDEIHRMNKDKQDILLPYLEKNNLIIKVMQI